MDVKATAEPLLRSIEGGAYDDLVAVYRSGQCPLADFLDAVCERASSIVGEDLSFARGFVALAVYHRNRPDHDLRWMMDGLTWGKARS